MCICVGCSFPGHDVYAGNICEYYDDNSLVGTVVHRAVSFPSCAKSPGTWVVARVSLHDGVVRTLSSKVIHVVYTIIQTPCLPVMRTCVDVGQMRW